MSVQVTDKLANGELRITITGEFGFETARELLLVSKARWKDGATKGITVDMSGVTGLSSSGVGTLVLLSELAGDGRFKLHLDHCSEDVRQLFMSGILDKYFHQGVVSCDASSLARAG
jgi:anti-anti-sigma factor